MEIQKCQYCGSKEVIKRGTRKTQNRGAIQRFFCKKCKRRFVVRDAFFRMRNGAYKITMCIDLYFRGVSLRKIQEHLKAFTPHNSSHQTILNWIRRYCTLIGNFTDNLTIKTSPFVTFDEVEFKTKGKQSFFFDVMDMETRYMLASGYFYKRGEKELKSVLKQASRKASIRPTDVYTDGLNVYPRLLRKCYAVHKTRNPIRHHITTSTDRRFNWKIERLHENIRERTKTIRQFKSLNSAKSIMRGYEIFYNFCRKHQGINAYPYEKATDLELGENKWLDLIKLSMGEISK